MKAYVVCVATDPSSSLVLILRANIRDRWRPVLLAGEALRRLAKRDE